MAAVASHISTTCQSDTAPPLPSLEFPRRIAYSISNRERERRLSTQGGRRAAGVIIHTHTPTNSPAWPSPTRRIA